MKHIDKNTLKHFSVCFLLSTAGGYGVAFAMGGSLCKEWRDSKLKDNHWCWVDLFFDILGCVAGFAIHWWIFRTWNF